MSYITPPALYSLVVSVRNGTMGTVACQVVAGLSFRVSHKLDIIAGTVTTHWHGERVSQGAIHNRTHLHPYIS